MRASSSARVGLHLAIRVDAEAALRMLVVAAVGDAAWIEPVGLGEAQSVVEAEAVAGIGGVDAQPIAALTPFGAQDVP